MCRSALLYVVLLWLLHKAIDVVCCVCCCNLRRYGCVCCCNLRRYGCPDPVATQFKAAQFKAAQPLRSAGPVPHGEATGKPPAAAAGTPSRYVVRTACSAVGLETVAEVPSRLLARGRRNSHPRLGLLAFWGNRVGLQRPQGHHIAKDRI